MDLNTLTNDQKAAYQRFIRFLLDPVEMNLIIQGSAGTGKSYLTKYLVEEGIKNYKSSCNVLGVPVKYKDYTVTATTNKAVESLANLIEDPDGKQVVTLTSFLKLHVAYNTKTHREELVPNDNSSIITNKIVFIDECSMINAEQFEYINLLLQNCKIIYIGDKYQLPPVKEKQSPIYNFNYPEVTLEQPVRNAGKPELVALCNQLKETCKTGVWNDIKSVAGSIEVIKDGEEMEKRFITMFKEQNPEQKVLSYSNQIVSNYAQYIMELRGEKEYLVQDAWYTSNSYYVHPANGKAIKLHVDSPVQIKEIKDITDRHPYEVYQIAQDEFMEKKVLKAVKIYSPKLGISWWDVVFATPELYLDYMKNIRKSNFKLYMQAKDQTIDLRRSESCTVHKAQGATLDTVLIDLYDISSCKQKDLTAKLLYVAASRAKNKIIFYGDLNKRYGVTVQ